MELNRLQALGFGIRRFEPYLPIKLHEQIKRITGKKGPSKKQLEQIELLGENLGLAKSEIHAALDQQLGSPFMGSRQRMTQFVAIVTIFIVAIIAVLVAWFVTDPESFPIPTYIPGSLYGTITPTDFSIQETVIQ